MSATVIGRSLTAGVLAMTNLQAQIDGLWGRVTDGYATVSDRRGLIELIALRGRILGRIVDYEATETLAEALVHDAPENGVSFIDRARARTRFHRFVEALADLDEAERLRANLAAIACERAAIYQALGLYDRALTMYRHAANHQTEFESLAALATLCTERADIKDAEAAFDASGERYRGVSPFPLSFLDFQRGCMWFSNGDYRRARIWFEASVQRLPAYAAAQAHLAEIEAATGDLKAALTRLFQLNNSSDDPEYAASLARILNKSGRTAEACEWRAKAAVRYDELIANHPEAFADHAAEFWIEAGDGVRALRLARMNLEIRRTPRALALLARAAAAVGRPT